LSPYFADTSAMNFDAILDDLEASFTRLTTNTVKLTNRKPVGYSRVVFGKDHFSGLVLEADCWHLVAFRGNPVIATEPGEADKTTKSIRQTCTRLIGLWLRLELGDRSIRGRLLEIEGRVLIFREFLIPIDCIRRIELHAVDNRVD
jgi:hypothetical protein